MPSNVTGFTIASFEIYGTAVMVTLPLSSITVPIEMPSRSPGSPVGISIIYCSFGPSERLNDVVG